MIFSGTTLLLALSFFSAIIDASSLQRRQRGTFPAGVILDPSCESFRSPLQEALVEVKEAAIVGYITGGQDTSYFERYFRSEHKGRVIEVFLNIARNIEGNGRSIPIVCGYASRCTKSRTGVAFVNKQRIVICPQFLKGPKAFPPAGSCSNYVQGKFSETLSMVLLHEMIHLQSDNRRGIIGDSTYDPEQCARLANETLYDAFGTELKATENASNYVMLAMESLVALTMAYPARCRSTPSRDELRRLLSTISEDASFAKVVAGYNVSVPFDAVVQTSNNSMALDVSGNND